LTAAQRNAFKPQAVQPDEEKKDDKETEEKDDVKQTANPTSSWVTVDETSEEKS
jgi:hypothetical protein